MKNRYRFQKQTMNFADKKRMPVDERKVKDLLRNQHIFRHKINSQIGTYTNMQNNPQEHGILTYLNESAYGDMADLLTDINVRDETIPFMNYAKLKENKANLLHESDSQFKYLMDAMFTPLDMTDYEDTYVGWNELYGSVPLNRISWLTPLMGEEHPKTDQLVEIAEREKPVVYGTSPSHQAFADDRAADPEDPEEWTGYGAEVEDDEDEDYDEEEEEDEEYGDEDEEYDEEEDEWPPKEQLASVDLQDRFFLAEDNLRKQYNEIELGNFMKILNIKPHKRW